MDTNVTGYIIGKAEEKRNSENKFEMKVPYL